MVMTAKSVLRHVPVTGSAPPPPDPGVGRASTDLLITNRNSEGARPYIDRASHDSRSVYWRVPGDFWSLVFEGHRPSPVQNVTGYISSKKSARLPGEFEIRQRSGDLQFRPEPGDGWICDVGINTRRIYWLNSTNLANQEELWRQKWSQWVDFIEDGIGKSKRTLATRLTTVCKGLRLFCKRLQLFCNACNYLRKNKFAKKFEHVQNFFATKKNSLRQ